MKVKGTDLAVLNQLAWALGMKLDNVRQQGNFHFFTLRMLARTAEAPDAPFRKRGFSGRWTNAVCFHGHRKFYEEIFKLYPNALIVTCRRRWVSLADLNAHAWEVERQNAGSAFNPQTYGEQCDCHGGDAEPERLQTATVRVMKQSDLLKCPFTIMVPEHYRPDGSCKCDDAQERKKMIAEWEYTEEAFANIPLRA
jgi:hypothetical protein